MATSEIFVDIPFTDWRDYICCGCCTPTDVRIKNKYAAKGWSYKGYAASSTNERYITLHFTKARE